jgi:hypothetical protein
MRIVVAFLVVIAAACAPPCELNADCGDGEVCTDGICAVPVIAEEEEREGEGEEEEGEEGEGEEGEGEVDICGDGAATGSELCDDGNEDNFDACRNCQPTRTVVTVVTGEVPALEHRWQTPTGMVVGEDGASLVVVDAFGVYRAPMTVTAGQVQLGAVRRLVDLSSSRAEVVAADGVLLPGPYFPSFGVAEIGGHIYFANNGTLWEVPSAGGRIGGIESRALLVPTLSSFFDEVQALTAGSEPTGPFPESLTCGGVVQIGSRLFVLTRRPPFAQVVELDLVAERLRVVAGRQGFNVDGLTQAQAFPASEVLGFAGISDSEAMWVTKDLGTIRRHRVNLNDGTLTTLPVGTVDAALLDLRAAVLPMAVDGADVLLAANVVDGSARTGLLRVSDDGSFRVADHTNGDRDAAPTALLRLPSGELLAGRLFPGRIEQVTPNDIAVSTTSVTVSGDERATKRGFEHNAPIDDVSHASGTTVMLSDGVVWRLNDNGDMTRVIGSNSCTFAGRAHVTTAIALAVDGTGDVFLGQSNRLCRIHDGAVTFVAGHPGTPTSMVVSLDNNLLWATSLDLFGINLGSGAQVNVRGDLPTSNYSDVFVNASGASLAVDAGRSVIVNLNTDAIDNGIANNRNDPVDGSANTAVPLGLVVAASYQVNETVIVGGTGMFRVRNGAITKLTPLQTNNRRGHRDGPVASALFDGFLDVTFVGNDSFAIATPSSVRILDDNDQLRTVVGADRMQDLGRFGRLHAQAALPSLACDNDRCLFASADEPRITANGDSVFLSALAVVRASHDVVVANGREDLRSTITVVGATTDPNDPIIVSDGTTLRLLRSGLVLGSATGRVVAVAADDNGAYYIEDSGQFYRLGDPTAFDLTTGDLNPPQGPVSLSIRDGRFAAAWPGQEAVLANITDGIVQSDYTAGAGASGMAWDRGGGLWVVVANGVQRLTPENAEVVDMSVQQPGCLVGASITYDGDAMTFTTADVCTGRLLTITR